MTRAFIGLGSNLGDRRATIERAVELLRATRGVAVVAASSLRDTDPWGHTDQPNFLNGAVEVETELAASALLDVLHTIEDELGRVRDPGLRYAPRTLDLDLLLYGDATIADPGLEVSHPRLAERAFALEPLVELDPALALPDGTRLAEILGSLVDAS
jgi:2-amino-4-hydroxy-6-hydroxymethyldihydropteridine diphosphokinase